jgi:alpha-1,2-mannosyltransferase
MTAVSVVWWAIASGSLIDTIVFRSVALAVLHGQSPYSVQAVLPFVYPPAGILVTLADAVGSNLRDAALVWMALSIAALARTTWILVDLAWPDLDRGQVFRRSCWLFAGGCLLQPTLVTLSFGQVGLVLLWLVVEGMRGQPRSGRRPWLVGVAAAIKLTPVVVLVGLAAAGRVRAARWGLIGLVAATAAAAAISPAGIRDYLGGAWRLARDVNSTPNFRNHSILGVAADVGLPLWLGVAVAAVALVLGVALTAVLWRNGAELAGLCTVLVTGLLVSPVSWEHHWVAVYPSLVLLLREVQHRRVGGIVLLSTAIAGMLLWVDRLGLDDAALPQPGGIWWVLLREWYVVWGIAFLAWTAATRCRPTSASSRHAERVRA